MSNVATQDSKTAWHRKDRTEETTVSLELTRGRLMKRNEIYMHAAERIPRAQQLQWISSYAEFFDIRFVRLFLIPNMYSQHRT
jgi:hypothetical protein